MARFTIDRSSLPKPWADPLIFVLRDGDATLQAEVEQSAAIDYQSVGGVGLTAMLLAPQRTEDFVAQVEDAVERLLIEAAPPESGVILLSWDDLNPGLA